MSTFDVNSALDYRFVLSDGILKKISRIDNQIVDVLRPKQTKIVQIEAIDAGIVIREDYYKFEGSNIYLVDYSFKELWVAELPSDSDSFSNPVSRVPEGLSCSSWECWRCILCPSTGKILSKEFTK